MAEIDRGVGRRALIVMQGGEPRLERYYFGATAADPFETHSITKSVLSLLVGIAIDEGTSTASTCRSETSSTCPTAPIRACARVNASEGVVAALGFGGQMVAVARGRDAVIVVRGDPERPPSQPRVLELLLPPLRG